MSSVRATSASRACDWHQSDKAGEKLGYLAWHDKAARTYAKGERQTQCPGCCRWFFPWERAS